MPPTTKACLDPWSFLMIKADGSVCLCCWSAPIGNINDLELDQIVTGFKAQQLRISLLTGQLMGCCLSCPARHATTTDKLSADVETYLNDSEKYYTVSQGELIYSPPVDPTPLPTPELPPKKKTLKQRIKRLWKTNIIHPFKKAILNPSAPPLQGKD
jgi:hypothetical protein